MIDRIKGDVIHLTDIVDKQRRMIGKRMEQYNELAKRLKLLEKSYDQNDRIIVTNKKYAQKMMHKFKNLILKFQSFSIRSKEILCTFDVNEDIFAKIDTIIENVRQISLRIEPFIDVIIFTESRLTMVKSSIQSLMEQIENFFKILNDENFSDFMKLYNEEWIFFKREIENLEKLLIDEMEMKNTTNKSVISECNHLLKNILLCFEKIFKYLNDTKKPDEDMEKLLKHSMNKVRILNLFNSDQIIELVDKFFNHFNENHEMSLEMIKIYVPFFNGYINLYQCFLYMAIGSLKTSSKLLHIIMSLSSELLANGFCLPPDSLDDDDDQQRKGEQQKNIDNAGFGDGNITSDAKDVSERLDCQDQLDDLENGDGDENQQTESENKNEDN
ncbi:hypothetical protein BLA29_006246, partial [Euroglyphus maynei]